MLKNQPCHRAKRCLDPICIGTFGLDPHMHDLGKQQHKDQRRQCHCHGIYLEPELDHRRHSPKPGGVGRE